MMRLLDLVETSRRVSEASGRLEKIGLLAYTLNRLEPDEMVPAVFFLSGELRQGRIGIGFSALRKATPPGYAETPGLTLLEVDAAFQAIAGAAGRGSGGDRALVLYRLLSRATAEEQAFLTRLIMGELRQGALQGVMSEAIAKAASAPAGRVRSALMLSGDLGAVARAALTAGEAGLARFDVRLFHPIHPMLAQTADNVAEALSSLGAAALEYKLDGARVQVHKEGEDVRVFTRRLNDVTAAVPEIVETMRGLAVGRIILDGETLALRDDGRPQPFQITMRR
ncbi:MAG: ATP-dependent DNA ligase, partial [Vicinamibacteria bacterium]